MRTFRPAVFTFLTALMLTGAFTFTVRAQSPGSLDATFDPGAGPGGDVDFNEVTAVAAQADGKVLVGGGFTSFDGQALASIARLNTDGTLDTGFNPGANANGGVSAIVVQPDGNILLGGSKSFGGVTRLSSTGSLDLTFDPGAGSDMDVFSLARQTDGKVVAGGSFATFNGVARTGVVRLDATGGVDTAFTPGTFLTAVYAVAVQGDGKVVAGGYFSTTGNGSANNYLVRLNTDGSVDTGFDIGTGTDNIVNAILVQGDGKILLGGRFSMVNGTSRPNLARLNADGSVDRGFNPGTSTSGEVLAMALQSDGKILITGTFFAYNGVTRNHVARLNTDGTLDTTFDPGDGPSSGIVDGVAVQADGGVLIGGLFTTVDSVTRNLVARLYGGNLGTIQFAANSYGVDENDGSVTLTGSRTGSSAGAVTVTYATSDGTAVAGIDYTTTNGTLSWADGDTANKTFTVPIVDAGITGGGTRTFPVELSAPTGGAVLGTLSSALVTITDNDTPTPTPTPSGTPTPTPPATPTPTPPMTPTPPPPPTPTPTPSGTPTPTPPATPTPTPPPTLPTVSITSLPPNTALVVGADLPLAASVDDPDNILSQVRFFLNGAAVGTASTAPFLADATAPATPGLATVQAVITDKLGRTNTVSETFNVAAANPDAAPPTASVLTPLNQRNLPAGSTLTISVAAAAASTTSLARVSLLADGALVAAFDGNGNPQAVTHEGQPDRRDAAAPVGNVFQATYTLPGTDKIINLVAVALDKLGQSTITKIATIHSTVTTDRAPLVSLGGLAAGAHVKVGTANTVSVTASDPDAQTSGVRTGRPVRADAPGNATLALLEYYLNGTKLGQATAPPFTFSFTPPSTGKYVLHAVATDGSGLTTISNPVTVQADLPVSTVNLVVSGTGAAVAGGANGVIVVSRTGGDNGAPLTISYKVKGAAVAGVDYKKLSGSVTIPAGAVKAKIKVKPLSGLSGAGTLKLKLQLLPSADSSYEVGISPVKIKLIGG